MRQVTSLFTLLLLCQSLPFGLCILELRPAQTVTLLEGSSLTFSCSPVYYVALPIVERNAVVFYDSRLSYTDHGFNTMDSYRHYTLVNVSQDDSDSVWRCIIGGQTTNQLTLIVHIPPDPPSGVVVSTISSTWIVVQWSPPGDNGSLQLTHYQITVSTAQHSTTQYTAVPRTNVTNLFPGQVYSAAVTAYSSSYSSIPSAPVLFTTLETGPLVTDIEALVHGPGCIATSWGLVYSGGTPLRQYELSYRLYSDELPNRAWSVTNITETHLLLRGLAAGSFYQFRVRGLSDWGYGKYSTSDLVMSHPIGVPPPPGPPVITCWDIDVVCLYSGDVDALVSNVTVLVYENSTFIFTQTLIPPLILRNITYHPAYQFSLILSNEWGSSAESPLSLTAKDVIKEEGSQINDVGPLIGSCVGLVNLCLLLGTLTLCVYMGNYKVQHKHSPAIPGVPQVSSRHCYLSNTHNQNLTY